MKTKITLKSSILKTSLLMAFLFVFVLQGASQSTENFEGETINATSFSHDGTTYTLSGANFDVEDWSGSHSPSTCIDNYNANAPDLTITISNSTDDFKVSGLYLFVGASSGNLSIQGLLNSSSQFTHNLTNPDLATWFYVDLSAYASTLIDELRFTASGGITYTAIDDITLDVGAAITTPSSQATNLQFTNIATTQANISWSQGNGSKRAVFIKQTTTGTASPVNLTTYTANTVFGLGSQIGSTGWYCIYNGTGLSTSVTGLTSNQTYRVHVCEYNDAPGAELYLTTSGTNNPANVVMDMGYAQTLETFEGEINPTFSENGYNFTVTGNLYVDNYPSDAYSGDYLVDNFNNIGSAPGVLGSFTNSISDFYVHSIAVNPNETTAATPNGTVSMIGKLNGSTLYTQTLTVNQTNDFPDNYYIIEFSLYNNVLIDELEFVTSGDINFLKIDNFEFSAPPLNSAPTINIANTTLAYVENDFATQIDAAATVSDVDGDTEWDGGKLDVQITASAEVADEISISDTDGDGTAITISGTNIFSNAVDIGDLSVSGGVVSNGTKLTITFDADATNASVQEVLQSIRYRNTSNDPVTTNRTITISATDKHAASATDTRTISVTAINDEPTLTATGATINFYEEGTSADLFSAISISTIESAQNIDNLILTVSNVSDLTYERLQIDGENVVLTDGNAGTTVNSSFNFSVSLSGSTATVIINKDDTPANYQTMIDGLGYDNTSRSVTAANRVFTITSISDNGSDVGANDATNNTLAVIATVMVSDNTAPSLATSTPFDDAGNATLGGDIVLTFNDNMAKGTGNITIRNSSDNSSFEVIDVTSAQVSIAGMDVTIDPSLTLLKGTAYYIEIDATALDDEAGNSFAGISGNTTLNFTTVDVVINEVVTEPQQDWSISAFSGNPGGTPGTNDEWVELFINSDGVDLAGWTIELIDGTDVIGDLTNTGAFDVSNYITAGSGSFSNTAVGDYLVLGNVDGAEAMNNAITITLKDPSGAIVDVVTFNTNPSSGSENIYNESAQRFPNGTDTDSNSDWTQGKATPGAANSGPSVVLTISDPTIVENGGTSTITATLSAICSENV
ncbi:MAG: Ig-like domain-containing protein, partial [Marinilabiliaceae bacterium]|nr:Ig-like domain-containing protein [Marinilabiliaceae bacterium]